MAATEDVLCFDALGKLDKLGDLVAIARPLIDAAAESRKREWTDADKVKAKATELKLERDAVRTAFGDALAVLERGPEDDAERAIARALYAHAVAKDTPKEHEGQVRLAGDLLWLATHTPFDALPLLDRALGDRADAMWEAIGDRVRRVDDSKPGTPGALGRGEALVGCAAIALSSSEAAVKQATRLAEELKDAACKRVVGAAAAKAKRQEADERISGEMVPAPRGPLATAALAFTGILFALHAARLLARLALAYKRPTEITLSESGVRIRARTELLGRTLRDREIVIVKSGLVRATREVRYPRAAFYAGLLALAVGSYVGVGTFVDGVRSASPSLLMTGLLVVALGIGADFVLGSLAPGAIGRCRVAFVPRAGPVVCVGGVDAKRADAALARLARA
jgi:hypothetical protein